MKPDLQRTTRLFKKLLQVAPELKQTREYAKSRVSGLMDLNLDVLERSSGYMRIALSHYYSHPSGDLIADPDMEVAVFFDRELAEALTYQDAFIYEAAYGDSDTVPDPLIHMRINEFLEYWLNNLIEQGHVLPRGR